MAIVLVGIPTAKKVPKTATRDANTWVVQSFQHSRLPCSSCSERTIPVSFNMPTQAAGAGVFEIASRGEAPLQGNERSESDVRAVLTRTQKGNRTVKIPL